MGAHMNKRRIAVARCPQNRRLIRPVSSRHLSEGSLTTEQAREIMALLSDKARIGEALENAERLARIEELLSPK